jgi:hypothetical protein
VKKTKEGLKGHKLNQILSVTNHNKSGKTQKRALTSRREGSEKNLFNRVKKLCPKEKKETNT